MSDGEIPLTGGQVTEGVVRLGDTVRRPPSPNSAFVVELLTHLENVGFGHAPRFLGYDDQQRETLTFLEGETPSDSRSVIWSDDQIVGSMRLLRCFHDATAGGVLAQGSEVVCHNDYGPWNLIWHAGLPIAIIDFDGAAPGSRLHDLGYAAWKHLNLGLIDLPVAEQRRRLSVLAEAYGADPDHRLLEAMRSSQTRMRRGIELAPAGQRQTHALAQLSSEQQWLDSHGPSLIGPSRAQ